MGVDAGISFRINSSNFSNLALKSSASFLDVARSVAINSMDAVIAGIVMNWTVWSSLANAETWACRLDIAGSEIGLGTLLAWLEGLGLVG